MFRWCWEYQAQFSAVAAEQGDFASPEEHNVRWGKADKVHAYWRAACKHVADSAS